MTVSYVFKRSEAKYQTTEKKVQYFLSLVHDHLVPDEHGQYPVSNLYFDTPQNDLIIRCLEHPYYKEKLRCRSYSLHPQATDQVFVELKKKVGGVVYKRRVLLPYQEAQEGLIEGRGFPRKNQILREIETFLATYHPIPQLYLAYDRICFVDKEDPNLRLTVDQHIRYRHEDLTLQNDRDCTELLASDERLLEIKTNRPLPLWLIHALNQAKIYPASFSKVGRIYEKEMTKESEQALC